MSKYLKIIFAFFLFVNLPGSACSCGCEVLGSSSTGFGGSIITTPAYTLPKNTFTLGTGIKYNNFEEFNSMTINVVKNSKIHAHSQDAQMVNYISASYGLLEKLTVSMIYPYNYSFGLKTYYEGFEINEASSIGFGDLTVQAKYKALDLEKHKLALALIAGIKMPTGQSNERDEFSFPLAADHQPSTGSWDPIMGLALSKKLSSNLSLDSSSTYRLSTPGNQKMIIGDLVSFNLGLSYNLDAVLHKAPKDSCPMQENWDSAIVLETNGRWQESVESQGIKDNAHGGLVVYLSPGLRLAYKNSLITDLSIGLPIIQSLNGIQPDSGIQILLNISKVF